MNKPKVVVLGAGYGGLMTVTRLVKKIGINEADITLVNKHNYHYETTWMHEASAGTLHHDRCRYQIKDVINTSRVNFVQDTVKKIDKEGKKVVLETGELSYDYLVVALGSVPETFGISGLKEHAFSISNINSSRQLREHIEYQFATYNTEAEKRPERLTIVVGGAGFTGIEFLGEMANRIPELCREYDIDRQQVRLICVEAAPSVLPGFEPELVDYAVNYLEGKGVEFKIGTAVKECTPDGIIVGKDDQTEEIKAGTVVWAAGVRGNPIIEESGFENMRGRVKVKPDLRVEGHDDIFVIGDCSLIINEETERPYPPTAQISMQQGETCANNLAALIHGKETETFSFDNKGSVASLGEHDAIGVAFGRKMTGTTASMMKKIIDNRSLFMIGGPGLVLKKGKFKFF
ncbi:NAD(P)/FAD-dependent oxidoreductase [Bacillus licheniformis]|uniref:FAD-dependent pyridine nucleotide-disulphide oxidoreductase YumB n=1 Tax=Bacillus licheniformis (strain ATCC 14580 / DSM 13 / JCM 2505 / CCUG 7422 / NBRC 12200 / NCIMB 9375 / NCTC 10341 / NRRL NRS-1264 / Gibson 46) TaxID=279010 RepID=Q65FE1_BACLD|nr:MULTISPECIES: NAD(P)/FAD-dependent oxidoreductase [Bacillus]AAU24854.2 FAD-dependent pyridine nucleotide-disulphide oxidoreductase YumB [Bacillus licheniformis DSM 13 = ATCC 14580]AKQ74645.1 YumB protein [Bacillus licheniformis WX-02]APJ28295.1 FAD-dependent oxidoreductase [Bacillus sp. H15-1]ASV16726.1 NAD(P)/FAD-dependent oxidoreductase [Bacillus sp. 1s-1]EQM26514.1 NADH dehydrogenase [Bacillus licheniformis CG-B52]KUL11942.1 NADH dehydrogenase [Bacillus licheniformis LMG 17339]MBY83478